MNNAKKTFLLPCVGCATEIEIVAGQAGGRAECPSCSRQNDVPTFRELNTLQIKTPAVVRSQPSWGLPQAVALAGVACAAIAWGAAAWVGSPPKSAFDLELLRLDIHRASDEVLYKALQDFSRAEVARTSAPQETMLRRQTLSATGMSRALYAIGGLGALAAVVSGLAILANSRSR